MANEHEDVSPASAGGALSPDQIRAIREAQAEAGRKISAVIAGTFEEQPDPRDAEIERLRADLFDYRTRLGNDLLRGGELVERVRAAMRVDYGGTCTRASIGVVGECVRDLCAEIEQLREARSELDRLRASNYADEQLRFDAYAELLNVLDEGWHPPVDTGTFREVRAAIVKALDLRAQYKTERDEARAERDRLRQELDWIAAQPQGSNPYWQQRSKRVEDERDRLRKELDLIHEQHTAGLVTLRTDFTAAVNGLLPKPAEPRRWVAGDPEPEIGTTVLRGDLGVTFTRRTNGNWGCNARPSTLSYHWDQVTSGPVVEVVTTDGE